MYFPTMITMGDDTIVSFTIQLVWLDINQIKYAQVYVIERPQGHKNILMKVYDEIVSCLY